MSPIIKRKADGNLHKIEGLPSKKVKHTTSMHQKPTSAEQIPPRRSPEPAPAVEPPSEIKNEADARSQKSFHDLGIIESLCDACTALGYKV